MTAPLDEKGLEAAKNAAAKSWESEDMSWSSALAAGIRAYLAASPSPSMEMEVVELLHEAIDAFDADIADGWADAEQTGERPDLWPQETTVPIDLLRQAQSALAARDAQVLRLTEENEALMKERDGKEAEFRDKVALGATDAEILRFRGSYPNPAGGPKVFYRYTIEQARYRYADAVLSARLALKDNAL